MDWIPLAKYGVEWWDFLKTLTNHRITVKLF
jgi:hypothetical protein